MKPSTQKHATRRNGHQIRDAVAREIALRIALYARVSTDEQADKDTIKAQLRYLQKRAEIDELLIIDTYIDEGVSGITPVHERPGGARLLADAQAGRFNTVWVYKVDRFARSLRVLLDGYTQLEETGIVFKSATEPFDTSTPMGKFLFQLLGSMAELDRVTLLERMSLGRDRLTTDGKWLNGPIPLGYVLDEVGCLAESERWVKQVGMTEADLIRDLFHRIAAGSSGYQEACRWHALGVPLQRHYSNGKVHTPADGVWHGARILKMIHSTTYYGAHYFKSRFGTIPREVKPLVSRELWERANEQVRRNRALPQSNATRVYLLRGLITCGLCRKSYTGQVVGRGEGKRGHYYRCNGKSASGAPVGRPRCQGKVVNALALEAHIWGRCRHFVLHPKEAMAAIERQMQSQAPETDDTTARQEALTLALAEKQHEEERLLTLFRRGRITMAAFDAEQDKIDAERKVLQDALTALRVRHQRQGERLEYFARSESLLAKWRKELERIEAEDDREAMSLLIADFVASVTVHPEGIHVVYRFEEHEEGVAGLTNLPPISPPFTSPACLLPSITSLGDGWPGMS